MTVIEDYSREAVAEVLAAFRETHRRMGEFQATRKTVGRIIEKRFGISYCGGVDGGLAGHVLDVLLKRGFLKLWDTKTRNKATFPIYQVNTNALLHNV